MRAWLNGVAMDGKLALDPADRGLTLGDGIFETVLVRDGRPIWLAEHLARMDAAATELGIAFPLDLFRSSPITGEVASLREPEGAFPRQNTPPASQGLGTLPSRGRDQHEVLRITLTRGPGHRGLAGDAGPPSLLVTTAPFDAALQFQPLRLVTAATRRNEHSATARLKTLSYMDNILADREAASQGADDALMLNTLGHAACATIGNIFAVTKNGIVTPPIAAGALPGIARLQLLRNGTVREAPLLPQDLIQAEALFITNSLRLVRPVSSLDGKAFASVGHHAVATAFKTLKSTIETC